ncbi:MAG: hypothetical protein HQK51_08970 [Oligoflexia bacterium]|nr:hypothetical protein [Oligoflexia bacterium]
MKLFCIIIEIMFLTMISISFVSAEYRLYQYVVSQNVVSPINSPQETKSNQLLNSYIILSTLDPVSYYSYHGGYSAIKIDLLRTWICPGYTGDKAYCDSPYEDFIKNNKKNNSNNEEIK